MIYTSYFSSKKFNPDDAVAITLGGRFWKGEVDQTLAPTPRILNWWKNTLTEEERQTPKKQAIYKFLYIRDVLSKLNPIEYGLKYQDKVLLCFEKSGDFCHRHIVAEWLSKNGFECKEL